MFRSQVTCTECMSDCGEGKYFKTFCNGSTMSDVSECEDCTTCPKLTIDQCTGFGTEDSQKCIDCVTCSVGEYMSRPCLGDATDDDLVCYTCKTSCPAGHYMVGSCDGSGTEDTVQCIKCTESCPTGSHLNGTCNGNETADGTTSHLSSIMICFKNLVKTVASFTVHKERPCKCVPAPGRGPY